MASREKIILDGVISGFFLPGIAQAIALRPVEGLLWFFWIILAWWHMGPWAFVLHILSAWRTAALANSLFDQLQHIYKASAKNIRGLDNH